MTTETKIYRDALGRPEPRANVSVFGSVYGRPGMGELCFQTVSDAPKRKWDYTSKDVSAIVAELEADGWACEVGHDGYNAPTITCIHRATQAVLDAAIAATDARWADATTCYVRYGDLPADGVSRDHRDNVAEAGVSVFRGQELPDGSARAIPNNHVLFCSMVSIMDRPLYVVTGDEVGTGADGEPVLANCKIIRKAN